MQKGRISLLQVQWLEEGAAFCLLMVKSARAEAQPPGDGFDRAFLQGNVGLGRGRLAKVWAGGEWKLQLHTRAFFSSFFSEPSSSWQRLLPPVARGHSGSKVMVWLVLAAWCPVSFQRTTESQDG